MSRPYAVMLEPKRGAPTVVACRRRDECFDVVEDALERSHAGATVTVWHRGAIVATWHVDAAGAATRYEANPLALSDYGSYCEAVADAYDEAPLVDPDEVWRWRKLIQHVKKFYKRMLSDIDVAFVPGQPYDSAEQMRREVARTGVLYISTDFNEHPIFTPRENLELRAVHDYIVHILPGAKGPDFSQRGEIRAYNLHRRLAPPDTWPALFTEVVAQACYNTVRDQFPVQKIAVLPFDYYNLGIEERRRRSA